MESDRPEEELLARIMELWPTAWACLCDVQQLLSHRHPLEADQIEATPVADPRRLLSNKSAPPPDETSREQTRRYRALDVLHSYEPIMHRFSPQRRRVVELLYGPEELSGQQVAERLGCSPSTVSYHKKEALTTLEARRRTLLEEKVRLSRKYLE